VLVAGQRTRAQRRRARRTGLQAPRYSPPCCRPLVGAGLPDRPSHTARVPARPPPAAVTRVAHPDHQRTTPHAHHHRPDHPRRPAARHLPDHHGPRVLIGARIDGDPHLFDVPAEGNHGTRYLVERGLATNDELQALIADYLAKAKRLGYPPMHGWI
jgi:hypothetical protein